MFPAPQLIVGTAGHIDHGKSRLVWALTGTDPDRLPEEKARGMTIDLGFAHARIDGCDVSFVDVPGHERFIRNMVAGATGVDLALLVVAADDSVMPQTREHAELLSLLGIERCIVVLTKMDLVDDEWADAVEAEVGELLASNRLTPLRCIRTSAETGRGLNELRAALAEATRARSPSAAPYAWFRLPIDRAFHIAGRGTVVTGSVAHGCVKSDQELELWPAGRRVRVRDLQTHNVGTNAAAGRMRLAVNLAGVSLDEVRRGCELATPGHLEATRLLDVHLATLRMPGKVAHQRVRTRLHIATSEVLAEVRLLEKPADLTVRNAFAQIRTAEPIVAAWGQRFILRDEAATHTLGGGQVLQPVARPWSARRPPDLAGLKALLDGPAKERLEAVIRLYDWTPCSHEQFAARAGLVDAVQAQRLAAQLAAEGRTVALGETPSLIYMHAGLLRTVADAVNARLRRLLADNPRLPGVPRGEWAGWMPRACPAKLRSALADKLIELGHVALTDGFVTPAGERAAISAEDASLLDELLREFEAAAYQPPAFAELRCRTPKNERRLRELLALAVARGKLVRIAEGVWLHERRRAALDGLISGALARKGAGLTVAELRTLLNSSRKYVVPLVEYLDTVGVTRRVGDLRVLGPRWQTSTGTSAPVRAGAP